MYCHCFYGGIVRAYVKNKDKIYNDGSVFVPIAVDGVYVSAEAQ